jgi:hypothetical protein
MVRAEAEHQHGNFHRLLNHEPFPTLFPGIRARRKSGRQTQPSGLTKIGALPISTSTKLLKPRLVEEAATKESPAGGRQPNESHLGKLATNSFDYGPRPCTECKQVCASQCRMCRAHQIIMTKIANGRLNEAELAVSAALASANDHAQNSCAGLILSNVAVFMSVSGRSADAERVAERAILIWRRPIPQTT